MAFDLLHRVETGIRTGDNPLDPTSGNRNERFLYDPSPWDTLPRALSLADLPTEAHTFVDVGCGKGKVLLSALRYPFRCIVGVEFSSHLCRIAQSNIATARVIRRQCRDVRVICADATRFPIPQGPCIFFFHNPFSDRIMEIVLANIASSYMASRRTIYLIFYRNAVMLPRIVDTLRRESDGNARQRASGRVGKREVFVFELPSNSGVDIYAINQPGKPVT